MKVSVEKYGELKSGKQVDIISLKSESIIVQVINYGSRLISIKTPDRDGDKKNILLAYKSLTEYENDQVYLGCVLGRCANRIKNSLVEIKGKKYKLSQTEGVNHLHGGSEGFDKKLWKYKLIEEKEYVGIELTYTSADGEEGYPGNLFCKVEYKLNSSSELDVNLYATSDFATPINLSIHPYFNLTGSQQNNILTHKFKINSTKILEVDSAGILTDEIIDISNTDMDISYPIEINNKWNSNYLHLKSRGGFDHSYLIEDNQEEEFQVVINDEHSGRILKLKTSAPLIHFYSGHKLNQSNSEMNTRFINFSGFAIEPQVYSRSNETVYPYRLLEPKQKFENKNKFRFSYAN